MLNVEREELFIQAGLQDRVIQVSLIFLFSVRCCASFVDMLCLFASIPIH